MSEVNDFQFKVILQCEQEDFSPARKQYCEYFVEMNGVERPLRDILKENIEQRATIDKLDQENADLLGARIKAQEEWEKCTDKLKEKILEQQAKIQEQSARIKELEIENEAQSDAIDGLQGLMAHLDLEEMME